MGKHTEGPWTVNAWTDGALLIDSVDDNPASVAVALVPQHMANQTANARLIAAAPDMLALLEQAIPVLAEHAQYDNEPSAESEILNAARAILARIKGE